MKPIDNGALFRFAELSMIDELALIFNVASVSADHSVPDFLIDFGTRASGTDINLMTVLSCLLDCLFGRFRNHAFIIAQCSVNVLKNNLAHNLVLSS